MGWMPHGQHRGGTSPHPTPRPRSLSPGRAGKALVHGLVGIEEPQELNGALGEGWCWGCGTEWEVPPGALEAGSLLQGSTEGVQSGELGQALNVRPRKLGFKLQAQDVIKCESHGGKVHRVLQENRRLARRAQAASSRARSSRGAREGAAEKQRPRQGQETGGSLRIFLVYRRPGGVWQSVRTGGHRSKSQR